MQRYAAESELVPLRAALARATPAQRPALQTALAWHLRQRHTREALTLADAATATLQEQPALDGSGLLQARLALVHAEATWLLARGELASRWLDRAEALYGALEGPAAAAGRSDLEWLRASLASDLGDYAGREQAMRRSLELAERGADGERVWLGRLALACFEAYADPLGAWQRHREIALAQATHPEPALAALAHGLLHHALAAQGRAAESITHALQAAAAAQASGQLRRAVLDITNAATTYQELHDHDGALACLQDALTLARPTGWPLLIGSCLAGTSGVFLQLGRLDAALALARESLEITAPYIDSKTALLAQQNAAAVFLAAGDAAAARRLHEGVLAHALTAEASDLRRYALHGLACVLAADGEPDAARAHGAKALAMARVAHDDALQIDALRLLARLCSTPQAALAALEEALALARREAGRQIPPTLLDELAAAQSALGRHEAACATLREAIAARDAASLRQAGARAQALELRLGAERVRADADAQRRLAETEAARARELQTLNSQLHEAMDELRSTQALLTSRNDELRRAYAAMQDLSLTDPLTGLRNRRFLTGSIEHDTQLCQRQHEMGLWKERPEESAPVDLVFLLLDLDHFKNVNDTHGHAAGDRILLQLRDRLLSVSRGSDYVVRWGGEEFLIVAREVHRSQAPSIAERLRLAVQHQPFELSPGTTVAQTCSVGWACFPLDPQHPRAQAWSDVIDAADRALYAAKAGGRNRSCGSPSPQPRGGEPGPDGGTR